MYKRITANGDLGTALWATNQYEASPLPSDQWGSYPWALTVFQGYGNILCENTSGTIYWASNITASSTNAIWILQDDGNFVGYTSWTRNSNGVLVITGSAFAATGTDGGKSSKFFGKMGKVG